MGSIVAVTAGRGIGELPYLSAGSRRTAYAGGFGAVAQPQFGQDVADVVLDRLAADEEPLGDLRVGQPLAEQLEDFVLAFGERLSRSPGRRDLQAEAPQQGGGGIDTPGGLQQLEAVQRAPGLRDRDLRVGLAAGAGEVEAAQARFERELRVREAIDRVPQPRRRITLPGAASGQGDESAGIWRRMGLGAGSHEVDGRLRVLATRELRVHEHAQQRDARAAGRVGLLYGVAQQVQRQGVLAASQVQRCPRPDRLVVALALQQHGRLVVPALLDPAGPPV